MKFLLFLVLALIAGARAQCFARENQTTYCTCVFAENRSVCFETDPSDRADGCEVAVSDVVSIIVAGVVTGIVAGAATASICISIIFRKKLFQKDEESPLLSDSGAAF